MDPDASARGLLGRTPDPLRYGDGEASDAFEAPGIIRSLMPDHVRVLDVGCGAGGQTIAINRGKGNDVVCVEPERMRCAAARMHGLTVHEGAFDEHFAAGCGRFDVIIFADVLEHVMDPSVSLGLARGCLNAGGSVIISEPNVAHWSVRLRLLFGNFDYTDGGIMDATHLRWFTRKSLLELLDRAGLEVVHIGCSAGLWMSEYHARPFSFLPQRLRAWAVLRLLRLFPGVMACQYVVQSRPRGR
jgi:SAM-dependent methyltransferase